MSAGTEHEMAPSASESVDAIDLEEGELSEEGEIGDDAEEPADQAQESAGTSSDKAAAGDAANASGGVREQAMDGYDAGLLGVAPGSPVVGSPESDGGGKRKKKKRKHKDGGEGADDTAEGEKKKKKVCELAAILGRWRYYTRILRIVCGLRYRHPDETPRAVRFLDVIGYRCADGTKNENCRIKRRHWCH